MSNVEVKVVRNMTPPTGGGANRGGVWGEGDIGFVILDFILVDGYISGVGVIS